MDLAAKEIKGRIVSVSPSGDLISDVPRSSVEPLIGVPDVRVELGDHFTLGIFNSEHGEPEFTLIAIAVEGGFVEVGLVGANAHEMLGVGVGEQIKIIW